MLPPRAAFHSNRKFNLSCSYRCAGAVRAESLGVICSACASETFAHSPPLHWCALLQKPTPRVVFLLARVSSFWSSFRWCRAWSFLSILDIGLSLPADIFASAVRSQRLSRLKWTRAHSNFFVSLWSNLGKSLQLPFYAGRNGLRFDENSFLEKFCPIPFECR